MTGVKKRIHVRRDSDASGQSIAWVQGLTLTEVKKCRDIPSRFEGPDSRELAHDAMRAINERLGFT